MLTVTEFVIGTFDFCSDHTPKALIFFAGFICGMIFEAWLVVNGVG